MSPSQPANLIAQAAELLARDPAKAEKLTRSVLASAPQNPTALLILGSARRRQGDPQGAYRILRPLAKSYQRAANTHFELGATLADLGRTDEAIIALRHAIGLNGELSDAWRILGEQLFRQGKIAESDAAFAELLCLSITNPLLKLPAKHFARGNLADALGALRSHLSSHPDDIEALHLTGETLSRQERFGDAEIVLARCLELDAGQTGARFCYATALFRQQKGAAAVAQAEHLLREKPGDPACLNFLAACLGLTGDDEHAGELYERLSKDYPNQPRIWLNYGHALRTLGQRDDALAAYRRCLELAPDLGEAYWSLADLKVVPFTQAEQASMSTLVVQPELGLEDRQHLHYALGSAFEQQKDYARSFEHYRRGAELRRARAPYSAEETTAFVRRLEAIYTREFFAGRQGLGETSQAPIFIIGLPRSGSTLIEQILASHSLVEGTRELPEIGHIARDLGWANAGDVYAPNVARLDAADLRALGRSYLEHTRVHRKLGRSFFIDKMPNNFPHVGLIHAILPGAKIIDARRHPLGACFSAFKQNFSQGQSFSYDLGDLGRYYRDYVGLMRHFDRVLPGRVHRVIYEDLVDDTETAVRKLLAYCEIPFEDGCMSFYRNKRPVRTVSSEQVRRPIFRDGITQWQHYESWLAPLKTALGPALENWRS